MQEELRECMRELSAAVAQLKRDIEANGMDDETRTVLAELRPQIEDLLTWLAGACPMKDDWIIMELNVSLGKTRLQNLLADVRREYEAQPQGQDWRCQRETGLGTIGIVFCAKEKAILVGLIGEALQS